MARIDAIRADQLAWLKQENRVLRQILTAVKAGKAGRTGSWRNRPRRRRTANE